MSETDTEKRTPTHCPHCGESGEDTAFDGCGYFTRHHKRVESDGTVYSVAKHYSAIHCPSCDGEFALLERTDERETRRSAANSNTGS